MFDFINHLRSESFEGWSEDSINGYMTALKTVEEKMKEYVKENEDKEEMLKLFFPEPLNDLGYTTDKLKQIENFIYLLKRYSTERFMSKNSDDTFILDVIYFLGLSFGSKEYSLRTGMKNFVKILDNALKDYR